MSAAKPTHNSCRLQEFDMQQLGDSKQPLTPAPGVGVGMGGFPAPSAGLLRNCIHSQKYTHMHIIKNKLFFFFLNLKKRDWRDCQWLRVFAALPGDRV